MLKWPWTRSCAPGGFGGEALHRLDVAAEVAHDVDRVRVQRLDLEVGRALARVHDPHAHVDEEQVAEAALVLPLLGQQRGRGEAVVEVDAVADALLLRLGDHLLGLGDLVGDRLLAQDVAAGLEGLHGGQVMVAAVLVAAGGDAAQVGPERVEHLLDVVAKAGTPKRGRGLRRRAPCGIAHADQFGQRVFLVEHGMAVADGTQADHADADHGGVLLVAMLAA